MRMARILGLRELFLTVTVRILFLCKYTVGQDCNGVYIDFQCHTFGLDDQNWSGAEDKCSQRYAVTGYTGAHLTSIGSAKKQQDIQSFMDRFGMRGAWVGATNKPLLWQWIINEQDIQAQGCYNDSGRGAFSYRAQITGLSSEGCIDACNIANFGYAGIQNGGSCVCAHALDSRAMTVGCNSSCTVSTSLSKWCGGPDFLTTVYRIGGANGAWGYNQPDMIPSQKSCAVLDMNLETKMADENCSMRYDYLCQMNATTCNGAGYQMISRLCYYVSSNNTVSWETARDKCRSDFNGELAVVDNNLLQDAIRKWFSTVFPSQNHKIWIGASKGGWYWMADYSFGYTNWAAGEPSDSVEDQCLYVDQALNYKWVALPCTQRKSFICQRGYAIYTTPALNWIGPTPPTDTVSTGRTGSSGGTVGTGGTVATVGTGGTGSTGSTVGTGSTGNTESTGNTGRTSATGSTVNTGRTSFTGFLSTTMPFSSNSTGNSSEPEIGANMGSTKAGWSKLAIGLFAFLAIVLFLCLLLCLLLLGLCLAKNRGNKVGYAHHYDARPIAHVPNSGEHFSSTTSLKNAAEPVGTN